MVYTGPSPIWIEPFDGKRGTAVTAKALRLEANAERQLQRAARSEVEPPPFVPPTLADLAWMRR